MLVCPRKFFGSEKWESFVVFSRNTEKTRKSTNICKSSSICVYIFDTMMTTTWLPKLLNISEDRWRAWVLIFSSLFFCSLSKILKNDFLSGTTNSTWKPRVMVSRIRKLWWNIFTSRKLNKLVLRCSGKIKELLHGGGGHLIWNLPTAIKQVLVVKRIKKYVSAEKSVWPSRRKSYFRLWLKKMN